MTICDFPQSTVLYSTKERGYYDIGYNANCHGYTITGKHTSTSTWREVVNYSSSHKNKPILIYTYKDNISHSGRIEGNAFIHYIMRVGVIITPLAIALAVRTEFKDSVFILPLEKDKYNQHRVNHLPNH